MSVSNSICTDPTTLDTVPCGDMETTAGPVLSTVTSAEKTPASGLPARSVTFGPIPIR